MIRKDQLECPAPNWDRALQKGLLVWGKLPSCILRSIDFRDFFAGALATAMRWYRQGRWRPICLFSLGQTLKTCGRTDRTQGIPGSDENYLPFHNRPYGIYFLLLLLVVQLWWEVKQGSLSHFEMHFSTISVSATEKFFLPQYLSLPQRSGEK